MAYSKHFAVVVVVNGHIMEEALDGTVTIPFGSAYELSLINKNNRKAVAKIFIDNENVSEGGLIVGPNSTVSLDCHVKTKDKFLFVSQESFAAAVAGKSENVDRRNGVIRVEWTLEKEQEVPVYTPPPVYTKPRNPRPVPYEPWLLSSKRAKGGPCGQSCGASPSSYVEGAKGLSFNDSYGAQHTNSTRSRTISEGCTVSGGRSNASFHPEWVDLEKSDPVVIQLVLRGFNPEKTVAVQNDLAYCTKCGAKWRRKAKYCAACGAKRSNL